MFTAPSMAWIRLWPVRSTLGALLVAMTVLWVTACGGRDEGPRVRATLRAYIAAIRAKDYQRICDEVYAAELSEAPTNNGLPCEVAVKTGFEDVRGPSLRIDEVQVNGDAALAQVHTTAANQSPGDVAVRLTKQGGTWRIARLAAAEPQPPPNRKP